MDLPERWPWMPRSRSRRACLKAGLQGMVLLTLGPLELAHGAQVLAVRVWPASDYTRVTVESDTPLQAQYFMVPDPLRLVLDIEGLSLNARLKELIGKVKADDPYIAGVRVGQFKPHIVRMVIDLKQSTKPQVFSLLPVAAYQHRLVFDLHAAVDSDPLLALRTPTGTASTSPTESATAGVSGNGGGAAVAGQADTPAVPSPVPGASGPATSSSRAADAVNDALGDFIGDLRRRPTDPSRPGAKPGEKTPGRLADKGSDADEARSTDPRVATQRLVIVALDAGHGGEDPGAVGPSGLFEKDVALSIAKMLRARINQQPGMRAMLTRESDYFVPLHERVRKARRVQADLFMSIHADAFMNPQARGASVFALSEGGASSAAARWMAQKENSSDMVGGVNIKVRDRSVLRALLDMSTTAQIKDSLKLGSAILGNLGKVGRLHKAKVEQASFAVLKAPDIPSVLVETGFISNPEEEAKLRDEDYQGQLADALLAGIQRYFAKNPPMPRNRAL